MLAQLGNSNLGCGKVMDGQKKTHTAVENTPGGNAQGPSGLYSRNDYCSDKEGARC